MKNASRILTPVLAMASLIVTACEPSSDSSMGDESRTSELTYVFPSGDVDRVDLEGGTAMLSPGSGDDASDSVLLAEDLAFYEGIVTNPVKELDVSADADGAGPACGTCVCPVNAVCWEDAQGNCGCGEAAAVSANQHRSAEVELQAVEGYQSLLCGAWSGTYSGGSFGRVEYYSTNIVVPKNKQVVSSKIQTRHVNGTPNVSWSSAPKVGAFGSVPAQIRMGLSGHWRKKRKRERVSVRACVSVKDRQVDTNPTGTHSRFDSNTRLKSGHWVQVSASVRNDGWLSGSTNLKNSNSVLGYTAGVRFGVVDANGVFLGGTAVQTLGVNACGIFGCPKTASRSYSIDMNKVIPGSRKLLPSDQVILYVDYAHTDRAWKWIWDNKDDLIKIGKLIVGGGK